ncbi:hypothetical protein MR810_01865 [bacterium]|nr:hypothetical protein [bacterium]
MKKKTFVLLLALVLIAGAAVGGTLAWLTATTGEVKNTFTTSNIEITLVETKGGDDREFKMIPGCTIEKDPKVTVIAGSEKCYLFVKIEKSSNFDSFMTYTVAADWTPLNDTNNDGVADDGVYYRVIDTAEMGIAYSVLADDQVTVKGEVTKAMMNELTTATYPTLTFTAYASQYMKNNTEFFTAAEAWENAQPTT